MKQEQYFKKWIRNLEFTWNDKSININDFMVLLKSKNVLNQL